MNIEIVNRMHCWDMKEIDTLSREAFEFFIKCLLPENYNELTAINASKLSNIDRTKLAKMGFTFTTDRMNIPMGKVSQNRKVENLRKLVNDKRN